jgi:hypothetical protein
MTNINFDEQSIGAVNNNGTVALNVRARGEGSHALWGETENENGGTGVVGVSNAARTPGVHGESRHTLGGAGVLGVCKTKWAGVQGQCTVPGGMGVFAESIVEGGLGILAKGNPNGGGQAGRFEGNVEVTGDIRLLNADCAEDFDVDDSELKSVEAGTVMVLTENGSLQSSCQEYDKKVAGVISGASGYKPAIVLDRQQSQNNHHRLPIALVGKVYCKVDARHSSIEIGDLLTTSSTKGYAMKADDPLKAFGAVIGKALGSIKDGLGMIPVLIALQ